MDFVMRAESGPGHASSSENIIIIMNDRVDEKKGGSLPRLALLNRLPGKLSEPVNFKS